MPPGHDLGQCHQHKGINPGVAGGDVVARAEVGDRRCPAVLGVEHESDTAADTRDPQQHGQGARPHERLAVLHPNARGQSAERPEGHADHHEDRDEHEVVAARGEGPEVARNGPPDERQRAEMTNRLSTSFQRIWRRTVRTRAMLMSQSVKFMTQGSPRETLLPSPPGWRRGGDQGGGLAHGSTLRGELRVERGDAAGQPGLHLPGQLVGQDLVPAGRSRPARWRDPPGRTWAP